MTDREARREAGFSLFGHQPGLPGDRGRQRRQGAAVSERGAGGRRTAEIDGFVIRVGRDASDNDDLTFGEGRPRDLWLHVAGFSGSHVLVSVPEGISEVPREVTNRAAELAAYYSKARNARGKVPVHCCRVADVSKERGAPAGQVRLRRYTVLRVYPKGL